MTANNESLQLLIPLVVTFVAPFLIYVFRRNENQREAVSAIAAALAFLGVLSFVPGVLAGEVKTLTLFTLLPGIYVKFCADGLTMIFALIATFLWFWVTFYNIGYMRSLSEHAQTRYYFCFAVAIFGAVGVAMSANVFTLYLFYEVISVFTYPLVAHHQDEEAYNGARKYFVYLMGTSKLFFLPAMVLTYVLCGTLEFNLTDMVHGMFPAQVVNEHPSWSRSPTCSTSRAWPRPLSCPCTTGCPRPWSRPPRSRPCCTRWRWSRRACSPCRAWCSRASAST